MDSVDRSNTLKPASRYAFEVHTFGCKVNTYDTGLLQKRLQSAGYQLQTELKQEAKKEVTAAPVVHILNTCAVTHEASKEATRLVRRLKAKNPLSTVVVTGCAAQVDGEMFDTLPGVDLVVANSHKGQLEFLLDKYFSGQLPDKVFRSNIFRKDDLEPGGGLESEHTRAFLKIQDGCNSFCSFCVIPFARGKSRSLSIQDLVFRVNELHAKGFNEVVLTGVHIGDYECESNGQKRGLADLVSALLQKTKMPRFRLTSLEPIELTPALIELYADDRMCPHFHMSIQSANDEVLKGMKRKYGQAEVAAALELIAQKMPAAFVGMDVIAGFPGESEEQFLDTYQMLEKLPWTRLHVFPYSERPGTKALLMDVHLDKSVRSRRALQLRNLSQSRIALAAQEQIGSKKKVLVLKRPEQKPSVFVEPVLVAHSLSRDYWPVHIHGTEDKVRSLLLGSEIEVEIAGYVPPQEGRMEGYLNANI